MRVGLDLHEVVYLAKTMELKFVFAGPPIGGAKSGIDFDPCDPRKPEVLGRWFEWACPHLREYYATGGDLNVDEVMEVIPGCRCAGLRHPQEGAVRGHVRPEPEAFEKIMLALERGVIALLPEELGVPGAALTVSDVSAGYGLAQAVARLYERRGWDLAGARVMVEGFGAVGASAALELARSGARVVAVADAEKTLIDGAGLSRGEVEKLIGRRVKRLLPDDERCVRGAERDRAWELDADIFVAAALSDSIERHRLSQLEAAGVSVIACGANHPFREEAFGATSLQEDADRKFSIIPDIIGSAGTACTFSYLMTETAVPEPEPILAAVAAKIHAAVDTILDRTEGRATGLLEATLSATLDRVAED